MSSTDTTIGIFQKIQGMGVRSVAFRAALNANPAAVMEDGFKPRQ